MSAPCFTQETENERPRKINIKEEEEEELCCSGLGKRKMVVDGCEGGVAVE